MKSITGQRIPLSLKERARKVQQDFNTAGVKISLSQAYDYIGNTYDEFAPSNDYLFENLRKRGKKRK